MSPSSWAKWPPRRGRAEWIAFALFAAIVIYQVFVPPIVGLANNGDFGKIAGVFKLAAPVENEYKFLSTTYQFNPKHHMWFGFISSEHVIAAAAVLLNLPLSKDGAVDIRIIGSIHTALYLGAFYLALPLFAGWGTLAKSVVYLAAIMIFTDAMYVSWMNTFYMDTAAVVFLLLTAVFYVRALRWGRAWDRTGFVLCAVLFAGAKTQHCALALPLAILLLVSGRMPGSRSFRVSAAILIGASAALTWFVKPAGYHATGVYSTIFYEILPHSKNVDRDLRELGLDASYRQWIGSYAFEARSPLGNAEFVRGFTSRTSYMRIGVFFLRHPAQAYGAVRRGLDFAGRQRVGMGNFPPNSGFAPFAESRAFAFWSGAKRRAFEGWGSRYAFYFGGLCALLLAGVERRARTLTRAAAALCAMGLLAMCIAAFADAVEVTRHFFLFNALADVILFTGMVAWVSPRLQRVS